MTRLLRLAAAGMLAAGTIVAIVTPGALSHAAAAPATAASVSVITLHFRVVVGPTNSTVCDIVGDLYTPSTASAAHPAAAILTTNGFGGSKADQAYLGQAAGARGYVVLSYSGLGFGGSGCKIELDDPDWDGKAASQLISFLGGAPGIAYTDQAHTHPYPPLTDVVHDPVAHDGKAHAYDPRVGMVGGSYGGEVQFAAAGIDPRLDTIVPLITWNDLSYSLAPNSTSQTTGVSYATPGTEKFDWTSLFFGLGIVDGISGIQVDPSRDVGCPNFDNQVCPAKAELDALGYPTPTTLALARHASVASYLSHIRIPTLLIQGQADSLFNLNEAVATYQALRKQRTPVQMIWQSWGHSNSTPAPGEFASSSAVTNTYEGQRILNWFDHYLRGSAVSTGPGFAFYRDWIRYGGSGPDTAQYATAPSYPVGRPDTLYLSGGGSLVGNRGAVTSGSQTYVNAPGGVPTSYSETSAVQPFLPDPVFAPHDAPGTYASFSSAPLTAPLFVAGLPRVRLHLSAPTASAASPATMVEMFVKIYDVAPDGTVTLVHRLVAPTRIADPSQPVTVTLPGIVHEFPTGHRLELVIAASDAAYRNADVPTPVTVLTGPTAPGTLTLPVIAGSLTR